VYKQNYTIHLLIVPLPVITTDNTELMNHVQRERFELSRSLILGKQSFLTLYSDIYVMYVHTHSM
jgi:hypothetical protein